MSEPIRFEREEILSLLLKRVEGFRAGYRQNVAVLGIPGIGKSTLLRHLVRERLGADPSLMAVYLETGESENLVEWSTQLVRSLFYAVLQSRSPGDLPVRWNDLVEACSAWCPKAVAAARRVLELAEAGKADSAYQICWDLPGGIAQELDCRILLVLDEFHSLRCLPVQEPFRVMGRKVMVQSQTMFLVASSEPAAARAILREGLALLFGQFETIEMGPISDSTCLQVIRSVWPLGEEDPCSASFLVEIGQGHPDHLQHLIHGLKEWKPSVEEPAAGQRPVAAPSLAPAAPDRVVLDLMESLLWNPRAALRQRFDARVRSLPNHWSRLACVQLLVAVAGGAHGLPQMEEATGRSVSQLRKFLTVLEQVRWVEKEGSFYTVPDRLFRFWLVTAYPALQGVGLTDLSQGRAHFRREALRWIRRFRATFQQPFEDRMTAFLQAWNDEQVSVDGRRIRLSRVDRVERRSFDAAGSLLVGRVKEKGSGHRGRLFLTWEEALSEADARRIVRQVSQESDLRNHRKVLFSLRMPEVNARLILQQAKVKVWDPAVLNRLLEFYGLPTFLLSEKTPEHWFPAQSLPSSAAQPAAGQRPVAAPPLAPAAESAEGLTG